MVAVNRKKEYFGTMALKGCKKPIGSGRQPGSVNKTTSSIKAAFIAAFDNLGGIPALVEWGKENPTDFYKLVSRLIPVEVQAKSDVMLTHSITETDAQIIARYERQRHAQSAAIADDGAKTIVGTLREIEHSGASSDWQAQTH